MINKAQIDCDGAPFFTSFRPGGISEDDDEFGPRFAEACSRYARHLRSSSCLLDAVERKFVAKVLESIGFGFPILHHARICGLQIVHSSQAHPSFDLRLNVEDSSGFVALAVELIGVLDDEAKRFSEAADDPERILKYVELNVVSSSQKSLFFYFFDSDVSVSFQKLRFSFLKGEKELLDFERGTRGQV